MNCDYRTNLNAVNHEQSVSTIMILWAQQFDQQVALPVLDNQQSRQIQLWCLIFGIESFLCQSVTTCSLSSCCHHSTKQQQLLDQLLCCWQEVIWGVLCSLTSHPCAYELSAKQHFRHLMAYWETLPPFIACYSYAICIVEVLT